MASDERSPLLSSTNQPSIVQPPNPVSKLVTIEPIVFLYAVAVTLSTPIQQQFLLARIGHEMNFTENSNMSHCSISANQSDPDVVKQQQVQAETSQWLIYCNVCYLAVAFFSTIFLGGYTDKGGRKIGIVAPICGGLLSVYIMIFIILFNLPKAMILISAFLQGISGGYAVFLMATFSYISDVTGSKQRSFRVIVLEAALGMGCAAAYLSSGYLIKYVKYIGTYLILHIIYLVDLIWVVFAIPESVTKDQTVTFWTLDHFKKSFRVYWKKDGTGRRFVLLSSMFLLFVVAAVRLGTDDVQMLFAFDAPLCWNSVTYGFFKSGLYTVANIGSMVLTKVFQPKLGDLAILMIGCLSGAASCFLMSFANTDFLMIFVPLIGLFQLVPIGMIRAFNSKVVEPTEVGAMFAWVAWMELIGGLSGNVTFNSIYATSLNWFKGFAFVIIGIGYMLSFVIALIIVIRMKLIGFVTRDRRTTLNGN